MATVKWIFWMVIVFREWENGSFKGKGKMIFSNGDTYEGFWLNDKRNGEGTQIYKNGNKYVGNWLQGIRSGKGLQNYVNGDSYVGSWKKEKEMDLEYIQILKAIFMKEIGK